MMRMDPLQQTLREHWKRWKAPTIGGVLGLIYGLISQQIDFEAAHAPQVFIWLDNIVSVLLPTVFGGLAGVTFNQMRSHVRLNRVLSTENTKLQRHLLTQTLSAHILHEIRTPLHNLTALLESWQQGVSPEEVVIFQRNLSRLQTVTNQLSRWTSLDDEIDLQEPVLLGPWLNEFIADKMQSRLNQTDTTFERHVDPVMVHMHPLLLEQCFTSLLNNAVEAVLRGHGARTIQLEATLSPAQDGYVAVRIRNTGESYPEPILAVQGREPAESRHGLGLGLVLVWRSLELIGGSIQLSNADGQAHTELRIPGRPA